MPSPWPGSLSAFLCAQPGPATSQPSPRLGPSSPGARAHAEGRGLAAFPKAQNVGCLAAGDAAGEGDVGLFPGAPRCREESLRLLTRPPPLTPHPPNPSADPSTQRLALALLSASPVPGTRVPPFQSNPLLPPSPGIPQVRSGAERPCPLPFNRSCAAWLSRQTCALSRQVLSHPHLPRCSLAPDPTRRCSRRRQHIQPRTRVEERPWGPCAWSFFISGCRMSSN